MGSVVLFYRSVFFFFLFVFLSLLLFLLLFFCCFPLGSSVAHCALHVDPNKTPPGGQMRQVSCEKKELKNVHVPLFELSSTWTLSSQPHVKSTRTKKKVEEEEALEDRNRKIGELFEWVGMACLGSQRFGFFFLFWHFINDLFIRLYVNDRVDPYVCVYEPPTPSRIQNVTHLRWRGLLCPNFVQEVLDTIMYVVTISLPSLSFRSFENPL
jgi:hypothetical protein